MDAHEVAALISEALNIAAATAEDDDYADVPDGIEELNAIRTYEEDGILTRDAGFVLHMEGGACFQVTVVRSH